MVTRFQNGVLQIEAGQLIAALAPQNSPQTEHLFSRIGYSTEIVAQYFKLASNDGASAALRSSRGELTFAYNRQIVLSNAASDRWPRAGETKQLDLVSVYQDGAGQIGGVTFVSGDGALRVFAHRVSIEGRSTPQGTEFAVQDLGASPAQTVVPTKSVVDQCVYDRSATLALISYEYLAAGRTVEPPSPEAVFGGCTRLESGVRSRYESSDDALKIAQVIFGYLGTNWDGRSGFNFGGWVGTLRSAVLASLQPASDKSVSNGGSAVLTEIDVRIQNARRLAEFSALSPKYREVLADVILSLSAWSKVPANDKWLERVMRAAVRLDDVYVRPFKNFAATSPDAGRESQMVYLETASASLLKLGREVYDQALLMPDHTYLLSVHEYFFSRQPKEDYLRRELVRMRGGK